MGVVDADRWSFRLLTGMASIAIEIDHIVGCVYSVAARMRGFMRRLALLLIIACVTWTLPLDAQQSADPVIGFLTTASPESRGGDQLTAFHAGLRESGYTEGTNVRIEYRWANDDYNRLRVLAAELVNLRVNVIVAAGGHVSALVAHDATKEIPIVFTTVTDPVKDGLVKSLNRPGGNATGTAGLTSELDPKRLEFLHEMKPTARVIGVLVNPNRPGLDSQSRALQSAADKLSLKLQIQKAATDREIDDAFEAFTSQQVEAVLVTADPLFNNRRAEVLSFAASHSLPAIYQWREFVTAGGLMSYGPSITEAYHQAGINAGLILKGSKPADIPVVQPAKFQLVINARTARQLGLTVSGVLISLADEVIE
jgi:putative tryptophan/tyrosine transport system substrate-binding protein